MFLLFAVIAVIAASLLGGGLPWGSQTGVGGSGVGTDLSNSSFACKPSINKNRTMKVDVDVNLNDWYVNNRFGHPEFNKENDEWILVKENAPIPAFKALFNIRGIRGGEEFAEMEKIGIAIGINNQTGNPDIGKEVYIGTGWCNPETGVGGFLTPVPPATTPNPFGQGEISYCLDPLVQDVLFVLTRKGATVPESWMTETWPTEANPNPPRTKENLEKYFWSFNVYYKASRLPAEPTYDDLPCWMKIQCPNGSDLFGGPRITPATTDPNCGPNGVLPTPIAYSPNIAGVSTKNNNSGVFAAGTIDPNRPGLIIKKSYMNLTNVPANVTIADSYISAMKLSQKPNDRNIGTAYSEHFNVLLRQGTVSGTAADHALILDPSLSGHNNGPFWMFVPILGTSKPLANTLQLGSFVPGIPSFFYEWWTPSCKPALYFYPQKETALSVKVKPNGFITQSIPLHGNNGWNIIAFPNGLLTTDNRLPITNNYLYYEASVHNVTVPKDKGWIKHSDELLVFFNDVLPKLGLNKKEQSDFLQYWIPKLTSEKATYYVTLIDRKELDRVEPIEFSVNPDTFIRVRFYFEKLYVANSLSRFVSPVSSLQLPVSPQNRVGFVVVDWGGILANGSCGGAEISQ